MDLHIRGQGLSIDDQLRDAADHHWRKIERLLNQDRIVDAKLELRRHQPRTGGDYTVAQLTVQTGRRIVRSEEQAREVSGALDRAFDALESQIRRAHDRRATRKSRRPVDSPSFEEPTDGLDMDIGDDAEPAVVVRTKRFQVKPMDVDEAIEQLELLGHDFFLFENVDHNELNVLYRRRDGAYGLLAPSR